jgi:hypothetical protein
MSLNAVFWVSYGSAAAAADDDDDHDEKYCNTNLLSPPLPSPTLSLSLFTIISLAVVSAPTAPVGSRLMSFAVRQTDGQSSRMIQCNDTNYYNCAL